MFNDRHTGNTVVRIDVTTRANVSRVTMADEAALCVLTICSVPTRIAQSALVNVISAVAT